MKKLSLMIVLILAGLSASADAATESINASILQGLMAAGVPSQEVDEGVHQYVVTGVACEPSSARVICSMYSDKLKKRLHIGEVQAGEFYDALYTLKLEKADSFLRTDYVRCNRHTFDSEIECAVAIPTK